MSGNSGVSSDYDAIRSAFLRWIDSQNISTQDGLAVMIECIVAKLLAETDSEAAFKQCMYVTIENLVILSRLSREQVKK